jgi:hypothetical protein
MDKVNFSEWLELREEKDACYHKVKRRYKVWPSAYACVPTKTSKALTKEGWKHYEELSVGDEILTYSMAKDSLEFQPIKNLYSYQDAETYVVQNGNKGLKFECTPNHKWVVKYNSCKENIGTKKYTDLVNDMRLVTTEELLADSESNGKLVISSNYSDDNIVELENFNLIEERKADVWCPETDNGTWLMMQENDGHEIITITGNSGALVRCRKVGAKNWGISENVDKIAIRYFHEDGRGLMNNSSLNYDKLDDEEYSDVEDEYLGLSQPPSDLHNKKIVFAFTPEGEQKHNRLIELLSKASKKGVRREVLDLSDYQIEWQSGDGQLGLKKLRNQRDEFHEGTFDLEKERGLRGWFDRNKGKGWIDCKASKKGHLVPCGRKKAGKGTERKYPACRPTLSACNKSKHKKKTSKAISWKTKSETYYHTTNCILEGMMNNYYEWMNSITHFFENQENYGSSWGEIENFLKRSTCNEKRVHGFCSHPRCDKAQNLMDTASDGSAMSPNDMERIQKFIHEKSCFSMRKEGMCFHPACRTNQRHAEWIQDQINQNYGSEAI